ncbi:hypothetical protein X975_20417, partial [Stegodyphus mimosarum]
MYTFIFLFFRNKLRNELLKDSFKWSAHHRIRVPLSSISGIPQGYMFPGLKCSHEQVPRFLLPSSILRKRCVKTLCFSEHQTFRSNQIWKARWTSQ